MQDLVDRPARLRDDPNAGRSQTRLERPGYRPADEDVDTQIRDVSRPANEVVLVDHRFMPSGFTMAVDADHEQTLGRVEDR